MTGEDLMRGMRSFAEMMEDAGLERAVPLVSHALLTVSYKDWRFQTRGRHLVVSMNVRDSVAGGETTLTHNIPIPPDEFIHPAGALRWVLERVFDIERHEAMEHFLVDGAAPFFPDHSPKGNPYAVVKRDEPVKVAPYRRSTDDLRYAFGR